MLPYKCMRTAHAQSVRDGVNLIKTSKHVNDQIASPHIDWKCIKLFKDRSVKCHSTRKTRVRPWSACAYKLENAKFLQASKIDAHSQTLSWWWWVAQRMCVWYMRLFVHVYKLRHLSMLCIHIRMIVTHFWVYKQRLQWSLNSQIILNYKCENNVIWWCF